MGQLRKVLRETKDLVESEGQKISSIAEERIQFTSMWGDRGEYWLKKTPGNSVDGAKMFREMFLGFDDLEEDLASGDEDLREEAYQYWIEEVMDLEDTPQVNDAFVKISQSVSINELVNLVNQLGGSWTFRKNSADQVLKDYVEWIDQGNAVKGAVEMLMDLVEGNTSPRGFSKVEYYDLMDGEYDPEFPIAFWIA